jgi:hypothetical protein
MDIDRAVCSNGGVSKDGRRNLPPPFEARKNSHLSVRATALIRG